MVLRLRLEVRSGIRFRFMSCIKKNKINSEIKVLPKSDCVYSNVKRDMLSLFKVEGGSSLSLTFI